ncbi:MAG: AmmeMemoRadiSam system protein B [Acidobacteriota bacterium]
MIDPYPRLRALEALPYRHEGRPAVLLRDPEQISPHLLVVGAPVVPLLSLLDGRNSIADLQAAVFRGTGELVAREQLEALISRLDEAHFLENERFERFRQALVEDFRRSSIRPAFHAGQGYPDDPVELREWLGSLFDHPGGAGLPAGRSGTRIRGLIAPHIDLRVGGPVYTHPYRALAEAEPPELFVILGIGHRGLPDLFSFTAKDFQTPLGVAVTDRRLLEAVRARFGDAFGEDFSHRTEHTIEFQIVFLQQVGGDRPVNILPVLTSFSCFDLERPRQRELVERFVEGLRGVLAESGRNVCIIASVDLAHIGPRYGDAFRPGPELVEATLARDREVLETVAQGSAERFAEEIRRERDARRVCGFSAIYTLLRLLPGASGQLLALDAGRVDDSGSFVTYAGMTLQ